MKSDDIATLSALIGDVSRETRERLCLYADRLTEWNRRINLVSPGDLGLLWSRHIADCAQLVAFARTNNAVWLDIGSGSGLPGMVIAILVHGHGHVHLVESNHKKAAFLLNVVTETGAPATVHACRIEELHGALTDVDIVTARAVAPLPRLLQMSEPWLSGRARSLFQKGRDYRAELETCSDAWAFHLLVHPSRTDSGGAILEISGLRRAPVAARYGASGHA